MSRVTTIPLPDDLKVADLDAVFARKGTASDLLLGCVTFRTSRPSGPYLVTGTHGTRLAGNYERFHLTVSEDSRSLLVRDHQVSGLFYFLLMAAVGVLFLAAGVAMASPLDDWDLKMGLPFVGIGASFIAFGWFIRHVGVEVESQEIESATDAVFARARELRDTPA